VHKECNTRDVFRLAARFHNNFAGCDITICLYAKFAYSINQSCARGSQVPKYEIDKKAIAEGRYLDKLRVYK